jgi:hypothetical protein
MRGRTMGCKMLALEGAFCRKSVNWSTSSTPSEGPWRIGHAGTLFIKEIAKRTYKVRLPCKVEFPHGTQCDLNSAQNEQRQHNKRGIGCEMG